MKFSGIVGFWQGDVETKPGVWKPQILERLYKGDIQRNYRKFQTVSEQQNENLTLSNQITILSDIFARENWNSIRYVIWNGVKWTVSTVEVGFPRLTLEIGGKYNGADEIIAT